MKLDIPLKTSREVERLRTAVYRFFEMKARSPEGSLAVAGDVGELALWSDEAAAEFNGYWRVFRQEQPAFHGFRDI